MDRSLRLALMAGAIVLMTGIKPDDHMLESAT
jgi:hypothetical protein